MSATVLTMPSKPPVVPHVGVDADALDAATYALVDLAGEQWATLTTERRELYERWAMFVVTMTRATAATEAT